MPEETKPLKILLVDDDRFLLDMYLLKFKKGGCDVTVSPNSANGLEKLRGEEVFDIVIVDIIMPGMDGIEFLKKVRDEKLALETVFIMLTNQLDSEQKARSLGVDGYIIKASTIPSEVVEQVLKIYKDKKGV